MKNFILSLFLSLTLFGTVQGQGDHSESKITKKINVERIDVVVTVNSVNDIKNTFETNDIKDMMDMAESDQPISFELVCYGDTISSGEKAKLSYKVEGNSKNDEEFLSRVDRIREAALTYYNNKR